MAAISPPGRLPVAEAERELVKAAEDSARLYEARAAQPPADTADSKGHSRAAAAAVDPGAVECPDARMLDALTTRGCDRKFLNIRIDRLPPELPDGYRVVGAKLRELLTRPALIALSGPTGRGKSALATALCRWFYDHDRYVFYTTANRYLTGWQSRNWEQRDRWREKYERADLVVLDEVQNRAADNAPWLETQFVELIDKRYANNRATVLISNLKPDALIANLGEAVYRRIQEEGEIITTVWPLINQCLGRGR